jgi:hypothetical protein
MAQPSIESTLKSASGALGQIGFVEFTTDLVRNVYNVIVESSMDQLKSYAEFVSAVSQTVGEYQTSLGLGEDDNPATNPTLLKNCENYATNVLGLTGNLSSGSIDKYLIEGFDAAAVKDKRNSIAADLNGFDFDEPDTSKGAIENYLPLESAITTASYDLGTTDKVNIDKIIALKLRKAAADDYSLLITILKIGMQKIVVDRGLIATKLTFHVDANETTSTTSSDINIKSKSFGLTGGISGGTKKFGGRLSGGYNSSKLSVSVVNEKSSAVANMSADIVGEVRIEFSTQSFPSIEI